MSSWLLMFLLLLLILIHDAAQGLRLLNKGSVPSDGLHSYHQEKFEGVRSNEGVVEEWKSKKLSGRSTRKLITMIHISKNEKKHEEMKEENMSIDSSSKTHQLQPEDPDILDIAAMDYTLARRKPPIHN